MTIASADSVGYYTSLELDSAGRPHISHSRQGGGYNLQYTYWDGSLWQTEVVDSPHVVEESTCLILDDADSPHIGYPTLTLCYAYKSGSSWVIRDDVFGNPIMCSSGSFMDIDSSGNPHLVFRDRVTGDDVYYSRWDGSAWQQELIIQGNDHISLELDDSDNPHIARGFFNSLRYLYHNGTSWQTQTVIADATMDVDLELDSSGYPHIAYRKAGTTLKYAHWDGSSWQTEIVDSGGYLGEYCSLALDSSDRPHISYYDQDSGDLKYARWDGSAWQIETVDSGGDVGQWTSLELSIADEPRISYLDVTNGDLKYAWYGDDSGVESVELITQSKDDGVLLRWSILGDTPASVSVLRSNNENQPIALSGGLSGSATSWLDVSAEAGVEYAYWLEVTELDGTISCFGPSEIVVPGAVSELTLNDPYPNPASDVLTISYELIQAEVVELNIYDLSGRLVETLVSGEQTAGRHSVSWDSSTAATGVYLIRLEAAGEAITKRAVISR
ncbi:T9SS type A sorting domain-containing protein [bacterium]|nr:T9SS type A sorting domain-containing protein [bacterium]